MGARVSRGENLRCRIEVRDFNKALVNAVGITLTILDKDDVVIETKTMLDITHDGLGLYYYDYSAASDAVLGTNTALWDVVYAGLHRKARGYFIVTE